jgi:outer membrane protein
VPGRVEHLPSNMPRGMLRHARNDRSRSVGTRPPAGRPDSPPPARHRSTRRFAGPAPAAVTELQRQSRGGVAGLKSPESDAANRYRNGAVTPLPARLPVHHWFARPTRHGIGVDAIGVGALACLALCSGWSGLTAAQTPADSPSDSLRQAATSAAAGEPDTSYLAGAPEVRTLGLTLDQAQRLAAEKSPAVRRAAASLRSARGARMVEAGSFDPVLFGASERLSTDSPVTSVFAASELRERSVSGGATWLSPIGTSLGLSLSRVRRASNSPVSTLPLERRAAARLDFVQPLLRGFGPAATRGGLRAAAHELDAAERAFEAAELDVATEVENAYWELYAAERDLHVQRIQRQRAASFLREQMLRGRAGAAGPGAVATARTFLADQQSLLLDAQIRLGAAADRLAQTAGISPGEQARFEALDAPPVIESPEPLESALERALRANPALRAAERQAAAARARARRAAWSAWPTVEAFGGYGGSGLAGVGRRVAFGADTVGAEFDTGFGEAWDQALGDDNPDWRFGIRVRMPVGWRADRGEHQRQLGALERAEADLLAQRLALDVAVRRTHREVELSRQLLDQARELVSAAAEQVRIARLEYQAGRATAYDLVDLEADLARASFRESQALVRVARASSELRRLTASSMEGANP